MTYFIYVLFGILPSIIWLSFYLKKDTNPEPNRKIIKIFIFGILIVIPTYFLELGILQSLKTSSLSSTLISLLSIFIAIALIEEIAKYLVVHIKVLKDSDFDEPVDAIFYMIIAGLGFAAAENVLTLFSLGPILLISKTIQLSILRFLGATFLHALCSGTMGFFLAMSFLKRKNKVKFLMLGFFVSTLLHGLYNLSIINPELIYGSIAGIIEIDGIIKFTLPIIILIGLSIFLPWEIRYLKKMKGICELN